MYRRGMAFLMADIKGKTDKYIAHSVLSNFKPIKKPDSPPDPQKKITGFSGFQTALQMSKKSDLPKENHSLPKKDNESPGTYVCTYFVGCFFTTSISIRTMNFIHRNNFLNFDFINMFNGPNPIFVFVSRIFN